MALTVVLTPVLQKTEKCRFYQEIGGCYKGTIILKNSVPIRSIPFKCIFVHLEKALMRGKNECEIPLAQYIRLEYSRFSFESKNAQMAHWDNHSVIMCPIGNKYKVVNTRVQNLKFSHRNINIYSKMLTQRIL